MIKIYPEEVSDNIGLLRAIVKVLDDKQAVGINALCVEKQTSLCSYFIICEGRSTTHVSALADALDEIIGEAGITPLHTEGVKEANWIAIDYASTIVHIFDRNSREFYCLENLWRDSEKLDLSALLS